MRRQTLSVLIGWLFVSMSFAKPWVPLAPGIDYQDIPYTYPSPWSHIHVFKIDLQQNQLDLITAHEMHQLHGSIQQFADYGHALIALNGGFFDQAYQPLGLRIGHAHRYNALKSISWWGVFSIEGRRAHISSYKDFKLTPNTDFAIQSGPRLLINNTIPKLKPGRAERSALGINAQGHIIILVTENSPLTTAELAHLMQSSPLRCESALNLDGGSSTQLFAELNHFKLNTHRFNPVSDAILVQARKNTSH